jgi:hypothetical protein
MNFLMALLMPISYISTFPILCLAAQFSAQAYQNPTGQERQQHIPADCRLGTKAMVIKSVPVDSMDVIVFAIRGSKGTLDWITNVNQSPASPGGFLVGYFTDPPVLLITDSSPRTTMAIFAILAFSMSLAA